MTQASAVEISARLHSHHHDASHAHARLGKRLPAALCRARATLQTAVPPRPQKTASRATAAAQRDDQRTWTRTHQRWTAYSSRGCRFGCPKPFASLPSQCNNQCKDCLGWFRRHIIAGRKDQHDTRGPSTCSRSTRLLQYAESMTSHVAAQKAPPVIDDDGFQTVQRKGRR